MEATFNSTTRMRAAVDTINKMKPKLLTNIATRIVPKLVDQVEDSSASIFTEEERAQLKAKLELTGDAFELLLEACLYIFQKAAYLRLGPAKLAAQLTEALEMEPPQAMAFGEVWKREAPALMAALAKHSLGGPQVLMGNDWQVHLQVAEQNKATQHEPRAIFQLSTADHRGGKEEAFSIEFSRAELADFFRDIEKIQMQMDRMGV